MSSRARDSQGHDVNRDQHTCSLVCYGMLQDINCQLLRNGRPPGRWLLSESRGDSTCIMLRLTLANPRITIGFENEPDFAQLNVVSASTLNQVAVHSSVVLEAYMSKAALGTLFDSQRKFSDMVLPRFKLNINVSGIKAEGEAAGEILSDNDMFLQEPIWRTDQREYHNPHIWTFEEFPEVDIWLAGLSRNKSFEEQMAAQQGWNQVLDELSSFKSAHTDPDTSLLTARLLKHQTDALGFMTDRETGRLNDAMSYWRSGTDDNGILMYRHSLTAAERRERPSEPASGILADDMGLGKTLSAIALITSSKNRAATFALEQGTEQVSHGILTATKATLVVLPSLLLLEEWKKEIEKHTIPGALRITKYHGHDRVATAAELLSYDFVLTTYGTVTTEHRRSYRGGREVLYFLRWFRIILDEAHTIRSARTSQCKAILALYARHHWCLTGTPVSNKVEDLAPLLRFCRVPLLQDPAVFREHVTKITQKSFRQGCNALRQALSPVCLRRTQALLELPQPRAVDYLVVFSPAEQDRQAALFRHSRKCLEATYSGSHDAERRHTLLQAILQLRIFCNQGTFMPDTQTMEDEALLDPDEALTLLQEEDRATCANCAAVIFVINQGHDSSSGLLGLCSHVLCAVCRIAARDATDGSDYRCPKCEQVFAERILPDEQDLHKISKSQMPRSAKLEKLISDLLLSQSKEKSIVFSVWRKTLDVASRLCDDAGIRHVRIDGTVPQALRNEALAEFTTNPETSTLLMTLGTGALGLNLTAATRVHILEPQWNSGVEEQAIGRVVRMGQEKHATVIRYTVKDSVERQIQTYQRRKKQLAAGGFNDGVNHAEYDAKILSATFFTQGRL